MLMAVSPLPQFVKLRKLARVARSLMTKQYPIRGKKHATIFSPKDPKAFRRAYVEASLQSPFRVEKSSDGCRFWVYDVQLGFIESNGRLRLPANNASPIEFSPTSVRHLGFWAFELFLDRLRKRYTQLSGLEDGADDVLEQHRHDYPGAYYPSRVRAFMRMAKATMMAFCAEIAPDRLRVLRANYLVGPHCAGVIEAVTSPRKGPRWCQALGAYPALVYSILSYPNLFDKRARVALCKVIDKGEPLVPFLATSYGVSEAAIRRWRGVALQRCGRMDNPRAVVGFVGDLPQHLWPRSRADFAAAKHLVVLMSDPAEPNRRIPEDQVRVLTQGMKQSLSHHSQRIGEVLAGINDVRDSFLRAFDFVGDGRAAKGTLPGGVPFGRLVDLNRRWHQAHQVATKEAAVRFGEVADTGWPGILPGGQRQVGELLAVELTTPAALLQEGRALGHCVASYHDWCYSGRSRVVALRSLDGKHHRSTIELMMQRVARSEKPRLTIVQHYGRGNHLPPKEDVAAAKALLKVLRPLCDSAWQAVESPDTLALASDVFIRERMKEFMQSEFPQLSMRHGGN